MEVGLRGTSRVRRPRKLSRKRVILNEIARHHRFERPKEIGVFLGRHHADEAAKAQPGRERVGAGKRRTEQNSNDPAALDRSVTALDYDQSGIATTYDEARALIPARRSHWRRLLSAHVDRSAISLVVDLGCGTGRFSEMLAAELDAQVIALDPSEKMIEHARRRPETNSVIFGRASAHELPLPEGSVDLVFMSQIYHHLP